MTGEEFDRWYRESRRRLPLTFSDALHVRIAALLAGVDENTGGGPPSTRRRLRKRSTQRAATRGGR
jgi:hypothetical protein